MPQIFHVMFQSNYFHHQPPLIRPLLVHSFHLWHHQCWTQAVLFSDLLCVGAQSSRDSNCRPCTQIVADNYTCKLELDLWFCLDPLPVNPPHLHSCDTRSLLCAWSHPSLLFWFWYFSPARRNLKGKIHAHFYCPSLCPPPLKFLASVDSSSLCFPRVENEGVWAAMISLSSPCDCCVGSDMVTLGVIHRSQRIQFRSVTISPKMKYLAKCVTESLSLDYQYNPKASGSTGRSALPAPPMQGIDQRCVS